jgi:hypothetical protein
VYRFSRVLFFAVRRPPRNKRNIVLLQYIIGHIWEASNRRTKNTMTKGKRTKGQEILYKILHRKLWIEQHEPYSIPRVNSGATKEEAVPTPLVPPVMSLIFSISHEESESLRSYDLSSSLENLGSCCLFISINPFI